MKAHPYQDWPDPCRNLLMMVIAAVIAAVFVYFVFLQPKWKALRETRYDFARTENKLKESPWPRDSERLQTILNTYQKTLGSGKQSGLKNFSEQALKRATSLFNDKINDEYGSAALFISKASQIEYKDQYDRMNSTFQNQRIYLDQFIFGMDESTVEPEKYKMLLKVWTTEKLVSLAVEHKLKIVQDRSVRTGPHNQYFAAKISVLPERSYLLDEEDKAPFLLEFPVRLTVRCSMDNFLSFVAALQSDPVFLPMVQMEMLTDTSPANKITDEQGNLSMTDLEVTVVCSSFYRPSDEQRKAAPKKSLPVLPPGA
ncbi:MAG: hypothetical protein PHY82_11155 [Lentisphaeria bacterium]|nr:hypothetical protein [Lentisphaeria bacterium]